MDHTDEGAARYYTGAWLEDLQAGEPLPIAHAGPAPAPAGEMLREAAGIAEGKRTHGQDERSFQALARLWTAYLLNRKHGWEDVISPADAAHMMALLKMARAMQGEPARDHWVDMASYCALAGELSGARQCG